MGRHRGKWVASGAIGLVAASLLAAANGAAVVGTKALGDAGADLVYTPVAPCRLVDTRNGGQGWIVSNGSRDFKVWVAAGGFTAQGGDSGNCNVPANPAAVALNLTVVNASGAGNLIVYPAGSTIPNTSALNYDASTGALANGTIVPACVPNCANQITVRTNGAATDVIVDIVGYFKAPGGTIGTVTAVTASAPLASSGGSAPNITLPGPIPGNLLAPNLVLGGTTSGTFSGSLTGNVNGNVAGNVSGSSASFTGALVGDVTGTQGATAIATPTVTGKALTGLASAPGTITAADTILSAIGKLNANVALAANKARNVIVVAKSGGDFATIGSALASISDNTAANPYLIFVAPGIYTEQVTMKPYVDIQGSGQLTTKIRSVDPPGFSGTVVGASNAELRELSVEAIGTGASGYTVAIFNDAASPRITNVTAYASFGNLAVYGVWNNNGSAPIMTSVTATATSPANVTSVAGIRNYSSSPTMTNVVATGISPSGVGIWNDLGLPVLTNVIATGACLHAGQDGGTGIVNFPSSAEIRDSVITAACGTASDIGIYNWAGSGSYTVTVVNSRIISAGSTISTNAYFTTRVAGSQLDGGPVTGPVTCAGVYDEAFVFSASGCP